MLPFLRNKKIQSAPATTTTVFSEDSGDGEYNKDAPLEACAQDLINAVHSNNVKGVADALQSAFLVLESNEEYEEGEE